MADENRSRAERLKELFLRLEPLTKRERTAVFDADVPADPAFRDELTQLLEAADQDGKDTLFDPLVESPSDFAVQQAVPDVIGPYKVGDLIGSGGMARVYRAHQERPLQRTVALKLVRGSIDSEAVVERFNAERRVLSALSHRNIATVLDAGVEPNGPSWFAMTLVEGPSLTEYCDDQSLGINERLHLFSQVCFGVQHAHTRGVIHRDLKPSNILVATEDGAAVPKIIDFGVAKALGADTPFVAGGHTLSTQIVGTLEYMSPEQARFGNPHIDARADVYALGVILYELLTGSVPFGSADFDGRSFDEIQSVIQSRAPRKPRSIAPDIPEELELITLKAIEKHRDDRYSTAKELCDDIARYAASKPISVKAPTRIYVLTKFARRNSRAVLTAGLILFLLIAGLVGTSAGLLRAVDRERKLIETDRKLERLNEFQSSRIGSIDLQAMGLTLRDGFFDLLPEEDTSSADPQLAGVDFTELARIGFARLLIDEIVDEARSDFEDDPELLASVLQETAEASRQLGLFEAGIPLQEEALALHNSASTGTTERALLSQISLAGLYWGDGRVDEAEALADHVRIEAIDAFGELHLTVLEAEALLALLYYAQGDYDRAETLYRSIADRWGQLEGLRSERRMQILVQLADVLARKGEFAESALVSHGVLKLQREVLADDDPALYITLHQRSQVLYRLDRRDEAEAEIREAVAGFESIFGSRHPRTLSAMGSMATILHAIHGSEEAIDLQRRVYELRSSAFGESHPVTIRSLANLGGMLATSNRFEEALEVTQRAYDIHVRTFGALHPDTLVSANTIGMAASANGDNTTAERYYRIAYEGRRDVLGPDHPGTLTTMRNLVGQLTALGRHDEAAPLADELFERALVVLPEGHRNIAVFQIERGKSRMSVGQFAAAEEDLLAAHSVLSERMPETNRFVTLARESIIDLYERWHEAEPQGGFLESADEWRVRVNDR